MNKKLEENGVKRSADDDETHTSMKMKGGKSQSDGVLRGAWRPQRLSALVENVCDGSV